MDNWINIIYTHSSYSTMVRGITMNATYVNKASIDNDMKFSHAFFVSVDDNSYKVVKDNFHHVTVGSVISKTMLNCYLTIIPSAAKVVVSDTNDVEES